MTRRPLVWLLAFGPLLTAWPVAGQPLPPPTLLVQASGSAQVALDRMRSALAARDWSSALQHAEQGRRRAGAADVAAMAAVAEITYLLARMVRDGTGTDHDPARYLALRHEAEGCEGQALRELRLRYTEQQDLLLVTRLAYAGEARAAYLLAQWHVFRPLGDADHAGALPWYRQAAQAGEPCAQYDLGRLYHAGRGVRQDQATAREWITRAAIQGHRGATEWLRIAPP